MFRRSLPLLLVAILGLVRPVGANPEDAAVKVYATIRYPNAVQPWMRGQSNSSIGTGVVLEGNRILTNLHIVQYGTEIHVEDRQAKSKVEAKIVAISMDADLALLAVDDEKFFKDRAVLPRTAQLPAVQDRVAIYGYPIGGNGQSITRGEVSRIEYASYGRNIGPIVQVSAAINPGNSGGPAVVDDKMIGIVVSRIVAAQNIGSIIPNEEIDAFLENVKRGGGKDGPVGKPALAVQLIAQSLENKALRRKLHVPDDVHGVLVQSVTPEGGKDSLQTFDVLTKIGDQAIDDAGFVRLKNGMRVNYLYPVARAARDDKVTATAWRKGQELAVSIPVSSRENRLIRPYAGEPVSYFIHGPLVFVPGRSNDVPIFGQLNRTMYIDNSPLVTRGDEFVRFPDEQLVVVSTPMFQHRIAKGYGDPVGKVVNSVNGTAVRNLRHLVELIRDSKEEFLTFRFADNFSEMLVFERQAMSQATDEVLDDNGIPLQRRASPDMLNVWKNGQK